MMLVLFTPLYVPFAIFTTPPLVTVPVAFLIDFLASNHEVPLLASFPPEPLTYIIDELAETVLKVENTTNTKLINKNTVINRFVYL